MVLKLAKLRLNAGEDLLVEPLLVVLGVADELLGLEPQADFVDSRLRAITAVDDVPGHLHTQISPNSSRLGGLWAGGSDQLTPILDHSLTFPDLKMSILTSGIQCRCL